MNNIYYLGLYDGNEYYRATTYPEYRFERKNEQFYKENEGFIKGNIQKNIYNPYKNYNPINISVDNERDRFLLEIQKYGFYLKDLGLYLDLHPTDMDALETFNDTRNKYGQLMEEFNKRYYPLRYCKSVNTNNYRWLDGKYPWVRGK